MATGKRYYWMKLKESFMTSDTIDYFMSQPGGANYVVLYQMLCLKTINTEGRLSRQIGEIIIPYDPEKIQRDCKWFPIDTIRVALKLYQAAGLIYEDQDGVLVLADHKNLVGSETDYAERNRRLRAQQREQSLPNAEHNVYSDVSENVSTDNRDREQSSDFREQSSDIKSEDTTLPAPQAEAQCPFAKIRDLYHGICISYPKIKALDGNRRKAVAARWRTNPSLDTFEELFRIAQASSFLKGQNDRNWSADFDWMMKPTNFTKILEHKYDERCPSEVRATGVFGTLAKMYEEAGQNDGTGND